MFSPEVLVDNMRFLGTAPTWGDFLIAIPLGTVAYTGIETISNMAGEAKDEAKTIPAAIKRVMIAVFAIYFTLPWIALSALPVRCDADGENCTTLLGVAKEDGGYASDPILGIVKNMDLGSFQGVAEVYVACLAVTILVAATNAGVLGVSRLVYSMGMHRQMPDAPAPAASALPHALPRHPRVLRARLRRAAAGRGGVPRPDLRVRRDALVLDGPPGADPAARHRARCRPGPTGAPGTCASAATTCRRSRSLGVTGTLLSFGVISALNVPVAIAGTGWLLLGILVYVVYRRRQGLDLTSTHKVAIAQPVVDHEAEYDSVLVYFGDGGYDDQVLATARKLAAQKRRGIHVLVTDHGPELDGDRRADARPGRARAQHRSRRPRWRAAAACRATSSACARARPAGGSSRRRSTCARPRS